MAKVLVTSTSTTAHESNSYARDQYDRLLRLANQGRHHVHQLIDDPEQADIIILDATHLNVFPANHVPGAVVQMMDRSNVETVIVAGKVRKWKGRLLDVDLNRLRSQLQDSRDFIYQAAGVPQNLFS